MDESVLCVSCFCSEVCLKLNKMQVRPQKLETLQKLNAKGQNYKVLKQIFPQPGVGINRRLKVCF